MRKYKIETKQKTHIFVTLLPTRILFVFVRLIAFKLNKYSNKRKPREKNYQFDAEFVVVVVIRICCQVEWFSESILSVYKLRYFDFLI